MTARDIPIIFSGSMIRGIIDGRKTQTRCILKPQPDAIHGGLPVRLIDGKWEFKRVRWAPGDRLWVKESFSYKDDHHKDAANYWYWADGNPTVGHWTMQISSMYMPRLASRITLEVLSVKIERLQDISCADAIAEGVFISESRQTIDCDTPDPRVEYKKIWWSLHGPSSWDLNPWVVAITFKMVNAL
jgi:hypothetical protein